MLLNLAYYYRQQEVCHFDSGLFLALFSNSLHPSNPLSDIRVNYAQNFRMAEVKANFFQIHNGDEKWQIWQALVQSGSALTIRMADETILEVFPKNLSQPPSLFLDLGPIQPEKWGDQASISCTFAEGNDHYFYLGDSYLFAGGVRLNLSFDLYRMNQRNHLRVQVPSSVPLHLNITKIESKSVFFEALVSDLSPSGLQVYFVGKEQKLTSGAALVLQLHPPFGKSFALAGIVCHVHSLVIGNEVIPQYGIQFSNLPASSYQRLLALTMELQKKQIMGFSESRE